MPNGIKYVIMSIVFVVITKLLQMVFFDSEENEKKNNIIKSYEQPEVYLNDPDESNRKEKPVGFSSEEGVNVIKKVREEKTKDTNNQGAGFGSTSDITRESLKNNYLPPLLAKLPEGRLREDVVVRYYRQKKDLSKVYKLAEMFYYIHEKEVAETAGFGSNVIYYGDDVPTEDIQLVAFTLLEEGIPLKSIKRTKFEWKAKAIEIGTDTTLINKPNISIQEIQGFRKQYLKSN